MNSLYCSSDTKKIHKNFYFMSQKPLLNCYIDGDKNQRRFFCVKEKILIKASHAANIRNEKRRQISEQ